MNEVVEESLTQQVAALAFQNIPEYKIAEELKITRYRCRKILASKEFKDIVREIGEDAVVLAKNYIKDKVAKLSPEIYETIRINLVEKRSMEAVKVALKVVGFEQEEEVKQAATMMQIILPGAALPPIEVPNEQEES
jgi:hypothetical protein